jgi:hypothetical protein
VAGRERVVVGELEWIAVGGAAGAVPDRIVTMPSVGRVEDEMVSLRTNDDFAMGRLLVRSSLIPEVWEWRKAQKEQLQENSWGRMGGGGWI